MKLTLESLADVAQDVREAIEAGDLDPDCRIIIEERTAGLNGRTYWEWYPQSQYMDQGVVRISSLPAGFIARPKKQMAEASEDTPAITLQ